MEITRSNVEGIQMRSRDELLRLFGLSQAHLLAKGTEAEVYALDDRRVFKIYADVRQADRLRTLQLFYNSVDDAACRFRLPKILEVRPESGIVATIEQRIDGVSLESLLPHLSNADETRARQLYFEGVSEIMKLKVLREPNQYMLFDESGRSSTSRQSWGQFYSSLVGEKASKVGHLFTDSITAFGTKASDLVERLQRIDCVPPKVVHGDFFPGNLMVKPDLSAITGVVDFGSFTLFGDPILDLAGALSFYRMYDPDRTAIRQQLLNLALGYVGPDSRPRLFRYILSNALLTCDLYVTEPNPKQNGHFQWALEILGDENLWRSIG